MPSWWQKDDAQAPPAMTAIRVRMVPFSVTTALTPAGAYFNASCGAILMDGPAGRHNGPGCNGSGSGWVGRPIAR